MFESLAAGVKEGGLDGDGFHEMGPTCLRIVSCTLYTFAASCDRMRLMRSSMLSIKRLHAAFNGCLVKLHLANDGINDLVGAALAAQIRRGDLALQKNAVDSGVDSRGRRSVAQVREQQGGGPKQAVNMEISRVMSGRLT